MRTSQSVSMPPVRRGARVRFALACAAVLAAAAPAPAVSQVATRTEQLLELSAASESLATQVGPAIVQVLVRGYAPGPGYDSPSLLAQRSASGSGVVLDAQGYIVTNAHVVEGARSIQVQLAAPQAGSSILKPRGKLLGAQLVGLDRETDLAVLKVEATGLPALELGDSDGLRQGQLVFAFGSPFGLENSVTMGVVSAVARQVRPEDPMVYVQTDAPINPGNSGGPLVDARGRVVGINTFIFSQSGGNEGLGFAAPSNIVRNVFAQLRTGGRVRRGEIGISVQTVTPVLAAAMRLPRDWGVIVGDVQPGGPAEKAGLRTGDLVVRLDGKNMENGRQFDVNVYRRKLGDKVEVEVERGGQTLRSQVVVVERPDDPTRFVDLVTPERNLVAKLGILGIDVDREVAALLPALRKPGGVVVAASAGEALYWEDRFQPGDVIHMLNGADIRDLNGLRTASAKLSPGQAVVAQVERRGRLLFVAFEAQ
jgi:serine protease Do